MDLLTDFAFSRLMLGTVQWGMPYGIANRQGQPTYEEARAILACAYEGGVNCLDTAAAYGTSEEVIGRALEELGLKDHFIVVTKLRHLRHKEFTKQEAEAEIEDSVRSSLRRLRRESLPIVLFHDIEDLRYIEA
ncbi:MAG TPA: aldo/keto reductase, partial [Chthonomonadales bacterium]|nr:aldo/keto reductase [Chthonomonadales bacterium]